MVVNNIVHMEPMKEFFIDILVKDIKLEKAILDLIDNAIDSAKKGSKNLSEYEIRLTLSNRKFIISDNCGGIPIERARNYAFKFGNANNESTRQFSIGHYGIGMKRAFFKIGNKIEVESATDKDFFSLTLDVNKWRKVPDWNIEFKGFGTNKGLNKVGISIQIEGLNEEAKKCFSKDAFIRELREEVSKTYKEVIKSGITIVVNGYKALISSRATEKRIVKYSIDKGVYIAEILINKDLADYKESGWNIYLNNRLVVRSDKTELSGWDIGNDEEYYKFRGNLYVSSKDEGVLPFNTTKDSLDTSNPVYRELKEYMHRALLESIPKLSDNNVVSIKYEKPRDEVEKLKKHFKVKYAKNVGEITYEDYLKRNKNIL